MLRWRLSGSHYASCVVTNSKMQHTKKKNSKMQTPTILIGLLRQVAKIFPICPTIYLSLASLASPTVASTNSSNAPPSFCSPLASNPRQCCLSHIPQHPRGHLPFLTPLLINHTQLFSSDFNPSPKPK